jgi:hypothetical protein
MMKLKNVVILGARLIALTMAMFISLSVASSVVGLEEGLGLAPEQAGRMLMATLAVCFMYAVVLAYPILRSRWAGWKLMATVALVYYGVNTFMSQIESAVFLPHVLPQGMLPKLFLNGALVAVLIAPLSVLMMGKLKPSQESPNSRLVMPLGEWMWKLAASTVLYMTLYFSFGLIAWQNPVLREFYAGGLVIPAWMPLFQIPRGLLWTALALPVIRMMKGPWWEAGLAVGLLFAVLTGASLLIPNNPIMPDSVRLTHCAELMSSNFIFGMLSTALMVWRPVARHVTTPVSVV